MREWNDDLWIEIRHALKLLEGAGVGIGRTCIVFSDALKMLPEDESLQPTGQWAFVLPRRGSTEPYSRTGRRREAIALRE